MPTTNNGDISELERRQQELERQLQALERVPGYKEEQLSKMGRIFGLKSEAALWVGAGVIVLCFIFFGGVFWADNGLRPKIIEIVGGVFIAAVGFVGGLMAGK